MDVLSWADFLRSVGCDDASSVIAKGKLCLWPGFSSPDQLLGRVLRAPQRCNAERSDAQRNFFTSQFIPPFLQRHRCDALPCFSASPVIIFYIVHIAFPPLLPFFLSPQSFTVQDKKFTKSHNAAMSPLATRDGHRKRNENAAMRCTKDSCLVLRSAEFFSWYL